MLFRADLLKPAAIAETYWHLAHQDRYAVRSGACVTDKAKELSAVMVERFGEETGYVGRRRNAAAE